MLGTDQTFLRMNLTTKAHYLAFLERIKVKVKR